MQTECHRPRLDDMTEMTPDSTCTYNISQHQTHLLNLLLVDTKAVLIIIQLKYNIEYTTNYGTTIF